MAEGLSAVSDRDVDEAITREELARHCRRQVRPPAAIRANIDEVVATFTVAGGRDSMGVELLRRSMARIWREQQHHLACL